MGRTLKSIKIDLPNVDAEPAAYSDEMEFSFETLREARKNSPYKPGDVILYSDGDGNKVRKAVVYCIIPDNSMRYGDYLIRYRCLPLTAKGAWSKQWRDIWPRYIERGYTMQAQSQAKV